MTDAASKKDDKRLAARRELEFKFPKHVYSD